MIDKTALLTITSSQSARPCQYLSRTVIISTLEKFITCVCVCVCVISYNNEEVVNLITKGDKNDSCKIRACLILTGIYTIMISFL